MLNTVKLIERIFENKVISSFLFSSSQLYSLSSRKSLFICKASFFFQDWYFGKAVMLSIVKGPIKT